MAYKKKVEIWEYGMLLIKPVLFGVAACYLWGFVRHQVAFPLQDEGVFEPILTLIGFAHGLIASLQIQKVAEQQQQVQKALYLKDKRMFDENISGRISPVIKLLLATFSVVFFVIFLVFPFSSVYAGKFVVWVVMFILSLLWEVASELDDPFHGIWKITQAEVDEIFKIKTECDAGMD